MWKQIRTWWAAEGAWAGLRGASDRTLADMGLERDGLRDRVLGREASVKRVTGQLPDVARAAWTLAVGRR